ncbi:MAG: hypothetical protein H0T46_35640 [Deltaproteobacteria bacterium]|nr:hypothetical protein [Deltaproteobacteria bacterium]
MRWLASLVVLCLVAGTAVRPAAPLRDADRQSEQQLRDADGVVPLVSPRRAGIAPDLRFTYAAVAPTTPVLFPPSRARIADVGARAVRPLPLDVRASSPRGPPKNRFLVEEIVRS